MWVGRVRGGVAMATVLAGAGFAAISGSSTAAAATLASTSIPAMVRQGYEPKLAGGVVAISGTLAMIIPPSIRSEERRVGKERRSGCGAEERRTNSRSRCG